MPLSACVLPAGGAVLSDSDISRGGGGGAALLSGSGFEGFPSSRLRLGLLLDSTGSFCDSGSLELVDLASGFDG